MDKTRKAVSFQSQLAILHQDFIKQFTQKYQAVLTLLQRSVLQCMDQGTPEFDIDLEKLNLDMPFNDFNLALQILSMDSTLTGTEEDWSTIFQVVVKNKPGTDKDQTLLHINLQYLVHILSKPRSRHAAEPIKAVKKLLDHYHQYLAKFIESNQEALLKLGNLIQDNLANNRYDMTFSSVDLDFDGAQVMNIYRYLQWRLLGMLQLKAVNQLVSYNVIGNTWMLHFSMLNLIRATEKNAIKEIRQQAKFDTDINNNEKQQRKPSNRLISEQDKPKVEIPKEGDNDKMQDDKSQDEWNLDWDELEKKEKSAAKSHESKIGRVQPQEPCSMCNKIDRFDKRPNNVGKDDLVFNAKGETLLRISFYVDRQIETCLSEPIQYCPKCGRKL